MTLLRAIGSGLLFFAGVGAMFGAFVLIHWLVINFPLVMWPLIALTACAVVGGIINSVREFG